jgi:hypothetical protein
MKLKRQYLGLTENYRDKGVQNEAPSKVKLKVEKL